MEALYFDRGERCRMRAVIVTEGGDEQMLVAPVESELLESAHFDALLPTLEQIQRERGWRTPRVSPRIEILFDCGDRGTGAFFLIGREHVRRRSAIGARFRFTVTRGHFDPLSAAWDAKPSGAPEVTPFDRLCVSVRVSRPGDVPAYAGRERQLDTKLPDGSRVTETKHCFSFGAPDPPVERMTDAIDRAIELASDHAIVQWKRALSATESDVFVGVFAGESAAAATFEVRPCALQSIAGAGIELLFDIYA